MQHLPRFHQRNTKPYDIIWSSPVLPNNGTQWFCKSQTFIQCNKFNDEYNVFTQFPTHGHKTNACLDLKKWAYPVYLQA